MCSGYVLVNECKSENVGMVWILIPSLPAPSGSFSETIFVKVLDLFRNETLHF